MSDVIEGYRKGDTKEKSKKEKKINKTKISK
jgi:hypothetical protein